MEECEAPGDPANPQLVVEDGRERLGGIFAIGGVACWDGDKTCSWQRRVSRLTGSGARLDTLSGEAPADPSFLNSVVCENGYNGTPTSRGVL